MTGRERREREQVLRSPETTARETTTTKSAEAIAAGLERDLARLRARRDEVVGRIAAAGPLDYAAVAKAAGEINKRAAGLKTRLMGAGGRDGGTDRGKQTDVDGDHMAVALVALCERIDSLVENPVFDLKGVYDVGQSAKAGGDLLTIIDLSARIRRGAERLKRAAR